MLTLLLVLSFITMAGFAAVGLLLSAEEQRDSARGQNQPRPGLSDLAQAKPR